MYFKLILFYFSSVLSSGIKLLIFLIKYLMYDEHLQTDIKLKPFWKFHYFDYDDETEDTFTVVLDLQSFDSNTCQGNGSSSKYGNFHIIGTTSSLPNSRKLNFQLTFAEKTLFFEGVDKNDNNFEGYWGPTVQDIGRGNFKLIQVRPKKGWNGNYTQDDIQCEMTFEQLEIGLNPEGKVFGKGSDENGDFSISGNYFPEKNKVIFDKLYAKSETNWKYIGDVKGDIIEGKWGWNQDDLCDRFRLYKI